MFTVPYTYAHRFDYLHKDVKREVINAVVQQRGHCMSLKAFMYLCDGVMLG